LHLFDGLRMNWQTMSITKDKQCQVCGDNNLAPVSS
ncbi:molybdopterin-synthase adenylyltransferase MoeB, partial [Vibrio sp. 2128(2023)]|nr:molybdopterin-synthase adenylyltransferase MoeB [Vibrio sp. 2128(2023)]